MNIQTIPRDQLDVKRAFVPKHDAFLSLDYPNIELKLLAYYLDAIGHPSMAQTFRDGADLHTRTASAVFGKPEAQITKSERHAAKTLNFSIVYGGGIPTLVRQGVAVDAKEALDMLRAFHGAWPGIGWQRKNAPAAHGTLSWYVAERMASRGYITTLWGRHLRPQESHKTLNALCQGCAADLMKWSLIQIHEYLVQYNKRSELILTVHDNAMLDCVRDELEELAEAVPILMTYSPVGKVVPITPAPEFSLETWADLKDWSEYEAS